MPLPDDFTDQEVFDAMDAEEARIGGAAASQGAPQAASPSPGPVPQDNSGWRYPRLIGHAALDVIAGTLGMPGDISVLAGKGLNAARGAFGYAPLPDTNRALPTTDEIQSGLSYLGLGPAADLTPGQGSAYPNAEKYAYRGLVGAGTGALMAPLGGGLLRGVASGLGGAEVGGVAADAAPGSVAAPLMGGLLGGLGGGGLAAMGEGFAKAGAASTAAKAAQAELAAAQAEKTALARGSPVKNQLLDQAQDAHDEMHADANAAAQSIVAAHGGLQSLQAAGEAAQRDARTWVTGGAGAEPAPGSYPALRAAEFAPINAAVPDTTPMPLTHFSAALQDMTQENGSLEPYSQLFSDGRLRTMRQRYEASRPTDESLATGEPGPEPTLGADATWAEGSRLRDQIGNELADPSLAKSPQAKNYSRLYAALSDDQRAAVQTIDPRAPGTPPGAATRLPNPDVVQQELQRVGADQMNPKDFILKAGGQTPDTQRAGIILPDGRLYEFPLGAYGTGEIHDSFRNAIGNPSENYALVRSWGNKSIAVEPPNADIPLTNQQKVSINSLRSQTNRQGGLDFQGPNAAQMQASNPGPNLQQGPPLVDLLDRANDNVSRLHQVAQDTMGKLINSTRPGDAPPGGSVAEALLSQGKTDGSTLATLRQYLPQSVDRLLAAHLTGSEGEINPEAWKSLGPEARAALVQSPLMGDTLDNILSSKEAATARLATEKGVAKSAQDQAVWQNADRLTAAKSAVSSTSDNAKLALAQQGFSGLTHIASAALGHNVGENWGHDLMSALGSSDPGAVLQHGSQGSMIGGALGLAAPWVARGAAGVVRNPARLVNPLMGGLAAENAEPPTLTVTPSGATWGQR